MIDGTERMENGGAREFYRRCNRVMKRPGDFAIEIDLIHDRMKCFFEKSALPESEGFSTMLRLILWFEKKELIEDLVDAMDDIWQDFIDSTKVISIPATMTALDMSREMVNCFLYEGILKSWQKGRGKGKRAWVVKSDVEMLQALARERPERYEALCEAIEEKYRYIFEGFQGRKKYKQHWYRPSEMACAAGAETGEPIFSDDSIFFDDSMSGSLDRLEKQVQDLSQALNSTLQGAVSQGVREKPILRVIK